MKNRNQITHDMKIGQAGVHRTMAELILRGHDPCVPTIDFGYDLVLGMSGTRIQVKTASLTQKKMFPEPSYVFRTGKSIARGPLQRKEIGRKWSEVCDFMILHGVTENRFWIVPSKLIDNTKSVYIHGKDCKGAHKDLTDEHDAPEIRRMLQSGNYSVHEIAALYGVGVGIVYRAGRGEKICPAVGRNRHRARNIRKLENRWDLIEDFIRTVKCPVPGAMEAVLEQGALV